METLRAPLLAFGGRVAVALLVLVVGWILAGWAGDVARKALGRARIDETLSRFLGKLARWGIIALVILACLSLFGVETTSSAAVIGSAGIAIGLAFQGTLSNFAAGIMLLVFRPFRVGDVIHVAGQTGKVDEIELFTTTIDSFDNRRFIIPNGQVFGATIENITYHARRRTDVEVAVAFAADVDGTRQVLTEAVRSVPGALDDPAPAVVLLGFGPSAVNWSVQVWAGTDQVGDVRQATIRAVKLALDQAGIGLASSQVEVRLRKSE
ncbi:MAG: mechanosensitive ion channel family protein [Thermoguttaceae bacterium]